ncbi:MAG TPA: hypothetical protein VG248_15060 [Caulobacteraceae bacterium]|jgi:hypothetical protein|nr:hypothetical protein [Caulobacteraceae bacterium]
MSVSERKGFSPPPRGGLATVAANAIWLGAGFVGAILAVVFAASVAILALAGAALLMLVGGVARFRRSVAPAPDPTLIEARRVGGHSWVAYGFDAPSTLGPDAAA